MLSKLDYLHLKDFYSEHFVASVWFSPLKLISVVYPHHCHSVCDKTWQQIQAITGIDAERWALTVHQAVMGGEI